jgi:hypothetical protein
MKQPITLTLQAAPDVDATIAVRRLLRYALRSCGLKCVAIRGDALELKPPGQQDVARIMAHETIHGDEL